MAIASMYTPFMPVQGQPVQPGPNAFPFSPAFGQNPMSAAIQVPERARLQAPRPEPTSAPLGLLGQAQPALGRYGSLLDEIRSQAGRTGLAQTLMALGRTTRRGEDRVLGAVQMGREAQQQAYQQGLGNLMTRAKIEELDRPQGQQFRTLSPQELRAAGFPEGSVVQQNTLTGQFDVIREAPSMTSTLSAAEIQQLGLPAGTVAQRDETGSVRVIREAPGEVTTLTPEQVQALNLEEGTIAQQDATGRITVVNRAEPTKQFEVLTPEQKTELGIPLNVTAQREVGTGKISAIGTNDLNIGTIPSGMILKRDQDGNAFLEPIEGSDIAKAAAQEEQAKIQSLISKGQNYDVVTGSIKRALDIIENEPTATGRVGAFLGGSPDVIKAGTKRADLEAQITNVRGNIGFDRLQRMREESPTGGALGNVAVRELIDLQATLGSLDLNQSKEQLRDNLNRIIDIYDTNIKAVANAYPAETLAEYGLGYLIPLKEEGAGAEAGAQTESAAPASMSEIPAGILPEEWEVMTPAERAIFQ